MREGSKVAISIGAPIPDLGENRYLAHFTSEIFEGDQLAGYLIFTRYKHKDVEQDKVPYRWLARPDSYMNSISHLVLCKHSRYAALPDELYQNIFDRNGCLFILDELILMPGFRKPTVYKSVLKEASEHLSMHSDGLLINEATSMAKYLEGLSANADAFWDSFGVQTIASDVYFKCSCAGTTSTNQHEQLFNESK